MRDVVAHYGIDCKAWPNLAFGSKGRWDGKLDTKTYRLGLSICFGILPVLVLILGGDVLNRYGLPQGHLAQALVVNGHAEAAGRLTMLATALLLGCAGIGCIAYFFWDTYRFNRETITRLWAPYAMAALVGVIGVYCGRMKGLQRFLDECLLKSAFSILQPVSGTDNCPSNRMFDQLMLVNDVQKYILVLFVPALILGALSCLALPWEGDRAACQYQARRLNIYLYLTATIFVIGLLFMSALLRWPGFAFQGSDAASYRAHVDALVLYVGVMFTLVIASYYVPVVIVLANAWERAPASLTAGAMGGGGGAKADGDNPMSDLYRGLNAVAAVFAPAIAGLLGTLVHF